MKNKKRLSKSSIKLIVWLSVAIFIAVLLILINIFIPIKYIGAYVNFNKDLPPQNSMRIRYMDVGYGDCAIVELPDGKTMLIDGGVATYSNVHKILKTLNSSGIDKLDYLICTSVKSEHCGGLSEIIKYKSVDRAYIPYVINKEITDEYKKFYSQLTKSGASAEVAEYGKGIYNREAGYFFYIFSPSVNEMPDSEYKEMNKSPTESNINAASIVVWLEYSGKGFLFLSDADGGVQAKIARTLIAEDRKCFLDGEEISLGNCEVVAAANHCGWNSALKSFYDLIKPEAAIISVEESDAKSLSISDFAVIQSCVGDKIYRTDLYGTITAVVKDGKCSINKEKQ